MCQRSPIPPVQRQGHPKWKQQPVAIYLASSLTSAPSPGVGSTVETLARTRWSVWVTWRKIIRAIAGWWKVLDSREFHGEEPVGAGAIEDLNDDDLSCLTPTRYGYAGIRRRRPCMHPQKITKNAPPPQNTIKSLIAHPTAKTQNKKDGQKNSPLPQTASSPGI